MFLTLPTPAVAFDEPIPISLRLAYAPAIAMEQELGGPAYTISFPLVGVEAGLDAQISDNARVGVSGAGTCAPLDGGAWSIGSSFDWVFRGWQVFTPLPGGRVSYSVEPGGEPVPPGHFRFDWPDFYAAGVMLQLRPGVRFPFGENGFGMTIAAEGRVSYRITWDPGTLFAGGLVDLVFSFDLPLGQVEPPPRHSAWSSPHR